MKLFFFLSICAWAQLEQPRIGVMLDSSGVARPIFGVSASVTRGDALVNGVTSMACARRTCVAKTAHAIVTWDASRQTTQPAPDAPALFAFSKDAVYIYCAGQLTRNGESVPLNVAGEILAMRFAAGAFEFAVRRDDGVWIVRDNDVAIAAIADATGPVILLRGGLLFGSGDETVLRRADASEVRFPIHADAFIAMGEGYVQIRSGSASYALRIATETVFQLPEAP